VGLFQLAERVSFTLPGSSPTPSSAPRAAGDRRQNVSHRARASGTITFVSTWYRERDACAHCGASIEAEIARGVHASRAPAVRDRVLRGELHRARCAGCGHVQEIVRALVYTDFPRGQWVHVAVPDDLARWPELEHDLLGQADRALHAGSPLALEVADRMRVRLVFGSAELRERLIIWEAGLNDSIVECVKLVNRRDAPAIRRSGTRIHVQAVTPGGDLEMATSAARWTTPAAVVATISREVEEWHVRYPELFRDGFVSIDRYLSATAEAAS
jgi:hypothetical protein